MMVEGGLKSKVIKYCQELVQVPSFSGRERECAEVIKNIMQMEDFDEVITTGFGSVVGKIAGNRPGKTLLLDGHMDTVGVNDPEAWEHEPFGAELVDDKIYGRGSTDMKGSLAAMVLAAANFARDIKREFPGDIYVSCSVHEEHFEGVASREISELVAPDFVVIGEPSSLNLARGQLGRGEIKIETSGLSAHSSNPNAGSNAVYAMTSVINRIRELNVETHHILGEGIIELTDIISEPFPGESVIPNRCITTYDRRVLIEETKESVLENIDKALAGLGEQDPGMVTEVYYTREEADCWTGKKIMADKFFPAWLLDEDHHFVQTALAGLGRMNLAAEVSSYSFCTNGSHYAGEKGIPTVGFGPSHKNLTHIVDEYIEVNQLVAGYQGFYGIIASVLA